MTAVDGYYPEEVKRHTMGERNDQSKLASEVAAQEAEARLAARATAESQLPDLKKRYQEMKEASERITKDSGVRAEFPGGMVRDTNAGKPRFDLLIPKGMPSDDQMLTRWAQLMARGALKYGDRNWESGRGQECYDRAREFAFRHFMQWMYGEQDEDHAAAVYFNIQAAEFFAQGIER